MTLVWSQMHPENSRDAASSEARAGCYAGMISKCVAGADFIGFIARSLEACMGLDGKSDNTCVTVEEALGFGYQS